MKKDMGKRISEIDMWEDNGIGMSKKDKRRAFASHKSLRLSTFTSETPVPWVDWDKESVELGDELDARGESE